ncbi:MAG: hypothetical protein K1X44_08020 [Alphaproteobacteria bacterium]|nr:hypothetical protein [Alphaproteobacteria bacterium]
MIDFELIGQILIHTPWWVYLLFAFLMLRGIKASKTRITKLDRLFLLPVIFLFFSIHTLLSSVALTPFVIFLWVGGVMIGALIGWVYLYKQKISVDQKNRLLKLPGTWSILIIILGIFSTKYYFQYKLISNPAVATEPIFQYSLLMISGIFVGFTVGRLLCGLYKFKTGPFEILIKNNQ